MSYGVDEVLKALQSVVDTSHTSDTLVQESVNEINEQDNAIATISDFTEEMQARVQNLQNKLVTAEEALDSVKTIAIQNTVSVEKLNETLKAE